MGEKEEIVSPQSDMVVRYTAIREKAQNHVIENIYKAVYMDRYLNGEQEFEYDDDVRKKFIEIQKSKAAEKEKKKKGELVLVTINPPQDCLFVKFQECVKDVVNKKWVERYMYNFETRGFLDHNASEIHERYKGVHVHILLYRGDKRPSELEREIKSTISKHNLFEKDSSLNNPQWVNFKYVPIVDLANMYQYVRGMKKGVPKKNRSIDSEMRSHQDIDYVGNQTVKWQGFQNLIVTEKV